MILKMSFQPSQIDNKKKIYIYIPAKELINQNNIFDQKISFIIEGVLTEYWLKNNAMVDLENLKF